MNEKEQMSQIDRLMGRKISVTVDRPVGYRDGDRVYPLNRGFATLSGGEVRTVYVLGIRRPLVRFTGRIIGGILGEKDFKLVAAPDGIPFHQAQIADAVAFAEGNVPGRVEAMLQKSCGAILYRQTQSGSEFLLLLQGRSETWSFPKGHMEAGETEKQTAIREISEETGLSVELIPDFRYRIRYKISQKIEKQVVLFLARADGGTVSLNREIVGYRWIPERRIRSELSPAYRKMMSQALSKIRQREKSEHGEGEIPNE